MTRHLIIVFLMALLNACSLAPVYHRPPMAIPEAYKEAGKWLPANPTYADKYRGPWWQAFDDPELNSLEEKVTIDNQNLQAAYARYQEALADVSVAHSALFPTVQGLANFTRVRDSTTIANPPAKRSLYNDFFVGANAVYELDVWGRIHNTLVASVNRARASAADLAAADLSMHAQLASDYFSLLGADRAQRVLDEMVVAYSKALALVSNRHEGGAAPIADVYQAQTQLENAETQAAAMHLTRARFEHAIAVLIGEPPANFGLPVELPPIKRITIAPEIPSTLLERRPDIAAAERRVQAANAEIGVARAAFFPDFTLSANLGLESKTIGKLFTLPSLFWSIGPPPDILFLQPTSRVTLFDGGRLYGLLKMSKATYRETVANYRQTVLTAFQEVEDNLAAERQLEMEYQTQTNSVLSAKGALQQSLDRYRGGIVTFLDVVVNENTALQTELTAIDILTQRQIASIQLIKALGGGFVEEAFTR